jgi:hypothetical protein
MMQWRLVESLIARAGIVHAAGRRAGFDRIKRDKKKASAMRSPTPSSPLRRAAEA